MPRTRHTDAPLGLLLGGLFVGSAYLLGKLVEDVYKKHHGRGGDGDLDYDHQVMRKADQEQRSSLKRVAQGFSLAGRGATSLTATALASAGLWRARPRSALFLTASTVGALGLERAGKAALRRPRPDGGRREGDSSSFPSGHTTVSTAAALANCLIVRREFPRHQAWFASIAVPFALAVGMSRPYLARHVPSDVLAGHALGTAWVLALHVWYDRNDTADRHVTRTHSDRGGVCFRARATPRPRAGIHASHGSAPPAPTTGRSRGTPPGLRSTPTARTR